MKHFGSIMDFTRERNEDIMRTFRIQLAKARFIIMPEIFQMVADSPSIRFWVSEERASIVVSAMLSGKQLPRMRANKREMFEEIYRRFLVARQIDSEKTVYELVSDIVRQPAPKFYLTPRTVDEIIHRIKRGWYEAQFDRYKDCHKYLEAASR
jgi:hypothetical protein